MPCYQFDIFLEPTDVVYQLIHKSNDKIKFLESSCRKICVADGTVFLYHDIVKPIISQNGDLVVQIRFIKSSGYPNNYFYILFISFTNSFKVNFSWLINGKKPNKRDVEAPIIEQNRLIK